MVYWIIDSILEKSKLMDLKECRGITKYFVREQIENMLL